MLIKEEERKSLKLQRSKTYLAKEKKAKKEQDKFVSTHVMVGLDDNYPIGQKNIKWKVLKHWALTENY